MGLGSLGRVQPPSGRGRRRGVFIAVGVAVAVAIVFAVTELAGTKVPSKEVLRDLPSNARLVLDRVMPGEGSLEQDDRLLGLISDDEDAAVLISSMVSYLEQEGWEITDRTGAGIAPDGICIGMRTAKDFLEDTNQQQSSKHAVEQAREEHGEELVVAVLTFC